MTALSEAAMSYASAGLRVLPLWGPSRHGGCQCPRGKDCASAAKHPRIKEWQRQATSEEAQVAVWWKSWPDANIGLACGEIVLIDVDVKAGAPGDVSLARLEAQLGKLPDTARAGTPTGGRHLLFAAGDSRIANSAGALAPGLDIRGYGGYFVAPPSRTERGEYRWGDGAALPDGKLAKLPAPWVERILKPRERDAAPTASLPEVIREGEGRNNALTSLAGSMRRRGASEPAIYAAIAEENRNRCRPPLADEDLRRIAASVARYEPAPASVKTPATGETLSDPSPASRWHDRGKNGRHSEPLPPPLRKPHLRRLADVQPEALRWLWPGRIPVGKLTLICGDPGLGKSLLTIDIAARASIGRPWPDDAEQLPREPVNVLILTAEDDLADTVRPRLEAVGGDVRRVFVLESTREIAPEADGQSYENQDNRPERVGDLGYLGDLGDLGRDVPFSLSADLPVLEEALTETGAKVLIVDPLSSYLGGTDSHVDADVRGVLMPLSLLASRHNVAVVCLLHLNKGSGRPAQYRVSGSIAFIAAARAAHVVTPDQDDPDDRRRLFLPLKQNLSAPAPGLAFITEGIRKDYEDGLQVETARLVWQAGTVEKTAYDALAEESSQLQEAIGFLRDVLATGAMKPEDVKHEAKGAGIAISTLEKAKKAAGVRSRKLTKLENLSMPWVWELLIRGDQDHQDHQGNQDHQVVSGGDLAVSYDSSLAKEVRCACGRIGALRTSDGRWWCSGHFPDDTGEGA